MIYIGMDDTDNLNSRGTGRLARYIAAKLPNSYRLMGVVRHQLLVDERIPMTSHNSCTTICIENKAGEDIADIFSMVRELMLTDYQVDSDPGLCVAGEESALMLVEFGLQAKRELVNQTMARSLALKTGVLVEGLGGSEDGIIGALAGVGLAAGGDDGRYILVGGSRELSGLQPAEIVIAVGIPDICTVDGNPVMEGMIMSDKLRPARRGGKPVQYVQWVQDYWEPIKLD